MVFHQGEMDRNWIEITGFSVDGSPKIWLVDKFIMEHTTKIDDLGVPLF